MASIFGFTINRKEREKDRVELSVDNSSTSMSLHVTSSFANQQLIVDDNMISNFGHIKIYRDMANSAEIDLAVDEIVNSIVAVDTEEDILRMSIDDETFGKSELVHKKILKEWQYLYNIMDADLNLHDWLRSWYIESVLYLYLVLSEDKKSIVNVVMLDSTKLKHIIESDTGKEYFLYMVGSKTTNSYGVYSESQKGFKIERDAIVSVDSGVYRYVGDRKIPVSMLHKAIKPFNQLKLLEDSSVVYRVVRAPEKRAFYIGVGDMPDHKARGYISDIMQSYRRKATYDSSSGTFSTGNDLQTMMEDYWLPRRDDGKNTEIQVLPGASNVADVTDIEYFKQKLFRSLNIPMSRFVSENSAASMFGRSTETNREEIKFDSFINKIRLRFSDVFLEILMRQCHLSGTVSVEDFEKNKYGIRFEYNKVNYFSELKKMEILTERMNLVSTISGVKEGFIPNDWIYREVLMLNDQEVDEIKEMLAKEKQLSDAQNSSSDDSDASSEDSEDSGAGGDFYDTSAFDQGGEEQTKDTEQEEQENSSNISSLIKNITALNDIEADEKTNFISNLIQIKSTSNASTKAGIASFINKNFSKISDSDIKTIASLIGDTK